MVYRCPGRIAVVALHCCKYLYMDIIKLLSIILNILLHSDLPITDLYWLYSIVTILHLSICTLSPNIKQLLLIVKFPDK